MPERNGLKAPVTRMMVTDGVTGETTLYEVAADNWRLIVGADMDVTGMQQYANGTTVLTIKPVQEARDE